MENEARVLNTKRGFRSVILAALTLFFMSSCSNVSVKRGINSVIPVFAVQATPGERAVVEASGKKWVISTQGRAATDAAAQILREGGNMIDAAVAASFSISVERPQSTGLGGGGFMLYRDAKSGRIYAIDFRERAPKHARKDEFVDERGDVIPGKSLVGIHAVAIPGLVKGLSEIHRRFGKMKFQRLVAPAAELAERGIEVYPYLAEALEEKKDTLVRFPATKAIFFKPDGNVYHLGEKIIQKDLANTLRKIGRTHGAELYTGQTARDISRTTQRWISEQDLENYRVKWRQPVRGKFKSYEIVSMPPPSSGGVHLIQILKYLEAEPLRELGFQSSASLHRIAAAMQSAFLDRARYMGDPDYVQVPVKTLLFEAHIAEMRMTFHPDRATRAEETERSLPVLPEHSETTHFSMMDAEGNVVVSTQTINGWFGSGMVVPGTGIILNNEMDDFSAKPGASNLFGAVGSLANSVQPGKTPLSSMSPTIVLENGRPRLAVGAPGGTRIITCVAQTILNHLVYGMPLYDSVNALRIHQQWKPDLLRIESPGFTPETEAELTQMGWKIEKGPPGCAVMAASKEGDVLHGVSEPRDHGKATAE